MREAPSGWPGGVARRTGARDDLVVDLADVPLQGQDGGVELAGGEAADEDLGLVLDPPRGELGIALAQGRSEPRQQIGRDGGDDADAQRAGHRIADAARLLDQIVGLDQEESRARDQLHACGGGQDPPAIALEQLHAQRVFQLRELGAERWLRDAAAGRGAVKAQRIGDSDGVLQLAQGERMGREVHGLIGGVYQAHTYNVSGQSGRRHHYLSIEGSNRPGGGHLLRRRSMYKSPSHLPETARAKIADALNARLADGLDLHSQIKVAHWNIKGPQFAALHPLFETFAVSLANAQRRDRRARRDPGRAGLRHRAARREGRSRLPEYPQDTTRDLEHVRLLAERIEHYLDGARESRAVAEKLGDTDTVDLLTGIITEFEKHAWFLRASLE